MVHTHGQELGALVGIDDRVSIPSIPDGVASEQLYVPGAFCEVSSFSDGFSEISSIIVTAYLQSRVLIF